MIKRQPADRLAAELDSFRDIWHGGYFEGDPLDPLARSSYLELGYMSVLHATYLACIKPYVTGQTVACEIGPGRGAWTKCLLRAKEVWCLDALSAEHNQFWEYVGQAPHVKYFQVSDFACAMLPVNHFDFLFSFGCFCHVSFDGISAYMTSLFPKLKPGAHGFIMVADFDKYNRAVRHLDELSLLRGLPEKLRPAFQLYLKIRRARSFHELPKDTDDTPRPGRWFDAGTSRTCEMLTKLSYRVLDEDIQVNHRDPVIHFVKD
jgi:hypothetical protein